MNCIIFTRKKNVPCTLRSIVWNYMIPRYIVHRTHICVYCNSCMYEMYIIHWHDTYALESLHNWQHGRSEYLYTCTCISIQKIFTYCHDFREKYGNAEIKKKYGWIILQSRLKCHLRFFAKKKIILAENKCAKDVDRRWLYNICINELEHKTTYIYTHLKR